MLYLLDSDVLIQAKNTYYSFDICPGFWDFLERECDGGEVRSIRHVRQELEAGSDELASWARRLGERFFLEPGAGFDAAMRRVAEWTVVSPFTDGAKRDFLAKADSSLVAHALADGCTVVTNEAPNQASELRRIKIPTACDALGARRERALAVLRLRGATFDLRPLAP
jgi:hypothetical protein